MQVKQYLHAAFQGYRIRESSDEGGFDSKDGRFFECIDPGDNDTVYKLLVEYIPDGKRVVNCMALSVFYAARGDRPTLNVHSMSRCGPNSGAQLMRRLDAFAASIDASEVQLIDFSEIELPPSDNDDRCGVYSISYSDFLVLATGQTYYNQFGYRSKNHEAETAHNVALIDRPFGTTFRQLAGKPDASRIPNQELWTQIVLGGGADPPSFLQGLSYDDSTRTIFSMLHRENVLHTLTCNDPLAFWIDAVIGIFRGAYGGIAGDTDMVKRYEPSTAAVTGGRGRQHRVGSSQRKTQRKKKRGAASRAGRAVRARRI